MSEIISEPMSDVDLRAPVAFVIFNRPAHTKRVFDAIAAVRPKTLFIIADGPRPSHSTDDEKCRQARAVIENVTWPCDVKTDFADTNMGCRARTISGTDWVFSQVNEAIFLEDDTVPHPGFFRFCQDLLRHYRDEPRVAAITGLCLSPSWSSKYSYGFSILPCTWGRAFWRRSWEAFDPAMTLWPEVRDNALLSHVFPDPAQAAYWQKIMTSAYLRKFDSWGYPFMFSCWLQGGLTAVPGRNLVRNIGFGPESTHTKVSGGYGKLALQDISFPLRHPPMIARDHAYDDYAHRQFIDDRSLSARLRNKIRRVVEEHRFHRRERALLDGQSPS
ncbi:glycosyltransferase family A protein [Rhodospirillaceae bacterium SYSU D60014]|uniref:glycosyltransferase family 2 protein n=1 Tax=Virgifigura deserti TaxID=2268457 RepID=UPI000E674D6D